MGNAVVMFTLCSIPDRGIGEPIFTLSALQEAMARRAWRASEKSRAQDLLASRLIVSANGSRFKVGAPSASRSAGLSPQSNDPRYIIKVAMRLTETLFEKGARYTKSGVLLEGLLPTAAMQRDLFAGPTGKSNDLLAAIDGLNGRYGRGTIRVARQGFGTAPSDVKRGYKSPAWTTAIKEVPIAS